MSFVPPIGSGRREALKITALSVSLANLTLLGSWQRRFTASSALLPEWKLRDLASTVFIVCVLAAIFAAVFLLGRKFPWRRWESIVFVVPLTAILNVARRSYLDQFTAFHQSGLILVVMGGATVFLIGGMMWNPHFAVGVRFIAMGLVMLFPINLITVAISMTHEDPVPALAAILPIKPGAPRVVWIILDELDYSLAFPNRPADLALPNLDAFRAASFYATHAIQAAPNTMAAVPSLTLGAIPYRIRPDGNTILVRMREHEKPAPWPEQANVLADARAAGYNVGVAGWYFEYCQLFAQAVSRCAWNSMYTDVTARSTFWDSVRSQLRTLTPLESRLRQRARIPRLEGFAEQFASDPNLGLVMLHLSVPHGPRVYSRERDDYAIFGSPPDWYYDNLKLADRVLGDIRRSMEQAGLWDSTTVIVTSDHSLRQHMMPHKHATVLVPYMVKLAHQNSGQDVTLPFNAVLTRSLIDSILHGEVTQQNFAAWLRQHAPAGPTELRAQPASIASDPSGN